MLQRSIALTLVACLCPAPSAAQAPELAEHVRALGTTVRVLVIGAHPDDEDTALLAWLARGRGVDAAYLSLTRGDGGQNLIGNELGEALGVIRTEELLAARRIDGAQQYFTRAYDFGYSKSAEETLRHWPRDSILRDVVTVVREFRPHIIVSVFSGTPRDGHGHHQVAGLLAREAFDGAADSSRLPRSATGGHAPWRPLKFYRSARFTPEAATLRFNVGEYSPLRGRSYYELAAASRSEHKSQGFGVLQRKGVVLDHLRREMSRGDSPDDRETERSLFDGIDTSWARLRPLAADAAARAAIDSLAVAATALRLELDLSHPERALPALARIKRLLERAWCGAGDGCVTDTVDPLPERSRRLAPDLERSLIDARRHTDRALLLASGAAVEATVGRPVLAVGDSMRVEIAIFHRGAGDLAHGPMYQVADDVRRAALVVERPVPIARDSVRRYEMQIDGISVTQPWWLRRSRRGDLFNVTAGERAEPMDAAAARIAVVLVVGGARLWAEAPVVYRVADPVRGELRQPLAVAPAISVTLDAPATLAPANKPLDRMIRVHLASVATSPRDVRVTLQVPRGIRADSSTRTATVPAGGRRTVEFRVRGTLPVGRHALTFTAESGGEQYTRGYHRIDYPHIAPQMLYRGATLALEAVEVEVPAGLTVAYIPGVGDNIAPVLRQLGLSVTELDPDALSQTTLTEFQSVVIGPRAYEAHPALVAINASLLDYVRRGGTLVVQYGQYEMMQPGVMPHAITIGRPHRRVAEEDSPVRLVDPKHPLLQWPNRITTRDFTGWVQERALYMPSTFSDRYTTVIAMSDPGEPPLESAILVTPYGSGTYVYTSLAFFRQLPAGVSGAARLFVNLLAAGSTGRAGVRSAR